MAALRTPLPQSRSSSVPPRQGDHPGTGTSRRAAHQPLRQQEWAGLTPQEVLARHRAGVAPPLRVLEVLLTLFNAQHTARQKTVSHKTRQERAQFLRRFFRDLHDKAGFRTLPDPRNLGQKHVRAMVRVWQQARLRPATIQTYLSFLRGLTAWTGRHGLVREPAYYGLSPDEYQRHEQASRDRSWSGQGVDIEALVEQVIAHDPHVGASLRLVRALGLRRKESVLFRPYEDIVGPADAGLHLPSPVAEAFARIRGKGGRVRHVPLDTPERRDAVAFAQEVVGSRTAHMGHPDRDLKQNLRRFDNVLRKFGVSMAGLGVTAHGLRHEVLIDHYAALTGQAPPVRGGPSPAPEIDQAARREVAVLAGHARIRSASAYLGAVTAKPRPPAADGRGD